MHTCTTRFLRLGHARRTPVQQVFRDWFMLDVHLYNKLSEIGSCWILCLVVRDTSLNIFPYWYFIDDYFEQLQIHLFQRWLLWTYFTVICQRWLLWTSSPALISTMSQCEHFYMLLFQRWYTLNIAAGIWRYDTFHCPSGEIQLVAVMKQRKKIKHPVY